ncbi:hypothetical protein HO675_08110 [Streptococcus suis]|nr:hypothetical protein [Streptococcus suis]
MIYSDRVVLIWTTTKDEFLGQTKVKVESNPIPCMKGTLTDKEFMGVYGKYNLDAVKLHLQGTHKGIRSIKYQGKERAIAGIKYHKNSTVVYV